MNTYTGVIVTLSPDLATQEVLNVGVAIVSDDGFCQARFLSSWRRVTQAFPTMRSQRAVISSTCNAIAKTFDDVGSRRLLARATTATTVFLDAMPDLGGTIGYREFAGLTDNAERTLEEAFRRFVVDPADEERAHRRSDADVWRSVADILKARALEDKLTAHKIASKLHEETFEHAWMNGRWNVAQPLSLDLADASSVTAKAQAWVGRILALDIVAADAKVHFLVGGISPNRDIEKQQLRAVETLRALLPKDRTAIVKESDAAAFVDQIERDLAHATGA